MHRLFCIVTVVLASTSAAYAQRDSQRPTLPAVKGVSPPVQEDAPAAPPNAPATVRLQFPNSDVVDVLHLYEQLTGKKLVMDNFVQGKVNIFIAKDVSREEAIKIIEMSMALNGISLVPAGRDIVDVVGAGQNPRKAPVPIISDLADIPAGNPVISFLFRLQYADPQELQQVLMAYFQGSSGTINILALPKSSSLLVTQNADIIRQLAGVIEQVDVAPAEVVSEFIKLERADASKVVDMLKDIFEKGAETPGQPGVRGVKVPGGVPQPMPVGDSGGGGILSEEAVIVGKIKITPDVRTNRIHVVTRPINMPFIRQLIHEFDANVEFAKPVTRYLKYVSAGDILPVLVQALTEPGTEQGAGAGGAGGLPGVGPSPGQGQAQGRGAGTSPLTNNYSGSQSGTGSSLNISEELSTQPVDTVPKAVTIGNSKLIADQRANSIIVLGNREVVMKVEKILDEMDVKAPQVALSTVIGQLSLNNNEEFGVDWFAKYNNRFVGISRNNSIFGNNNPAIPVPGSSAAPVRHQRATGYRQLSSRSGQSNQLQPNHPERNQRNQHLCCGWQRIRDDCASAGVHRPLQSCFPANRFHKQQQKSHHRFGAGGSRAGKYPYKYECWRSYKSTQLLFRRASSTKRSCSSLRSSRLSIPRRRCRSIFCKRSTVLCRAEAN